DRNVTGYKTCALPISDYLIQNNNLVNVKDYKAFDDSTPDILWKSLVTHLSKQGFDVATFDLTSPDIQEAGAYVVKSIIPGFKPIDVLYRGRMLGGKRLLEHSYN